MTAPISLVDERPSPPTPPSPPPRTPLMRVFGGLAVLVALAAVAWGCFSLLDLLAIRTYHSTNTLPIVHRIELQAGDAGVTIVPDATDRVVVDRTVSRGLRQADAKAFEQDGTLMVQGGCDGWRGWYCSVSMTIHVPTDTEVTGRLGDGNLSDRGTHGPVHVSSVDGDILLDGVVGPVQLQSGDGDVQIYALAAPSVQVSSGDGDVDVELASSPGTIALQSGDGDVDVCLPRSTLPYAVTTHLGDGNLDNQLPSDPSAVRTLSVTTGDGDARLHLC